MIGLSDGVPTPLGAHFDGRGVNFALFSQNATAVDLCLFEPGERLETRRIRLPCRTDDIWHGHLRGVFPGQLYGYRVHGPWDPAHGHRFNPAKLLLDPYAREIEGRIRWHDALYGHRRGLQREDQIDRRDSAPFMPRGVVTRPDNPEPMPLAAPRPLHETVIYEAHVKALTMTHPALSGAERGTYLGLAHPAIIEHLLKLGVTALELLPIQAFADDRFLVEKGLTNFWGYQPFNYFAPEPRYLGGGDASALRFAIRELAAAGIETLIDVVYNHTAEGDHLGPTLAFRGIDNASYYKLDPEDRRRNIDCTGCGNTLNVAHPRVMRMVLDSLRHWVTVYGVAGFRFDLASSLGRAPYDFTPEAAFFQAVQQDPVLSRVKLIAEPWDIGMGGYRLGGYPYGWSEWNDQFRDNLRGFWRGDRGTLAKLTQGLSGSREIFLPSGRSPLASINFVASHDGFTLADAVAYAEKHNEANGEGGRDGESHNRSWNCGVEGETKDKEVNALRARQQRNMLATLLLSQGVPMILHGDELGRTQRGNNNTYCQDSRTAWVDWNLTDEQRSLLDFTQRLIALKMDHPVFRRRRFFAGDAQHGGESALGDIAWFTPAGQHMTHSDWSTGYARSLGVFLNGWAIPEPDPRGEQIVDDSFYIMFNASHEDVAFTLPPQEYGREWTVVISTAEEQTVEVEVAGRGTTRAVLAPQVHAAGAEVVLPGRSMLVVTRPSVEALL